MDISDLRVILIVHYCMGFEVKGVKLPNAPEKNTYICTDPLKNVHLSNDGTTVVPE